MSRRNIKFMHVSCLRLFHWLAALIGGVAVVHSSLAVDLPLSVTPTVVSPGQTVTVNGEGFQVGAKAFVWGGGPEELSSITPLAPPGFNIYSRTLAENDGFVYAWAPGGLGISVIDTRDLENPEFMGLVSISEFSLGRVAASEGYLYLFSGDDIVVYDPVDATNPTELGRIPYPQLPCAQCFYLSGGYVYVAHGSSFSVFDFRSKSSPILEYEQTISDARIHSLDGAGSNLLLTMSELNNTESDLATLGVYELSDPANPSLIAEMDLSVLGGTSMVAAEGALAVVLGGRDHSAYVVDLNNASEPALVSTFFQPRIDWINWGAVDYSGGLLYVAGGSRGGLTVFDLTDPNNPKYTSSAGRGTYAHGLVVIGQVAYLAIDYDLQIIDFSEKSASVKTRVALPTPAFDSEGRNGYRAAFVQDNRAYILRTSSEVALELLISDISSPAMPVDISTLEVPTANRVDELYTAEIRIEGTLAYVVDRGLQGGVFVFDIADDVAPVYLGALITDVYDSKLEVVGDFAYVESGGYLKIFDVSEPTTPLKTAEIYTGYARSIHMQGDVFYALEGIGSGFRIRAIDVSDAYAPEALGSLNVDTDRNALCLAVSAEYAYVLTDGLVHVIDINDPASLAVERTVVAEQVENCEHSVAEDSVLYASGNNNLVAYDLSQPDRPRSVGVVSWSSDSYDEINTSPNSIVRSMREFGFDKISKVIPAVTSVQNPNVLETNVPSHLSPGVYDVTILNPDGTRYNSHNAVTILPALSTGGLRQFSLPSDLSNQTTNTEFPVTIEALLSNGFRDTSFNGSVSLSTNHSSTVISPSTVQLVNGYAVQNVRLDAPSNDVMIRTNFQGVSGESNSFAVIDPSAQPSTLRVTLRGAVYDPVLYDINVSITDSDGEQIFPVSQNHSKKEYVFDNLPPNIYEIKAKIVGPSRLYLGSEKNVEIHGSSTPITSIRYVDLFEAQKPPVLILPGFAGSTVEGWLGFSNGNSYPKLTKAVPAISKLRILDGVYADGYVGTIGIEAGFAELSRELSFYNTVYDVPWDWRVSLTCPPLTTCGNAWETYLLPAIDLAKDPDQDGIDDFQKVDIVAHSMGGLLVRSYIQSPYYRNDIDKFAMVGTPNMGSADSYFMVQGGDPASSDQLKGSCADGDIAVLGNCFYSQTTHALHKKMVGYSPFATTGALNLIGQRLDSRLVKDPAALAQFYKNSVPTGAQLLPTYNALATRGSAARALQYHRNEFLESLNSEQLTSKYTIADDPSPGDKVRTKIFASTGVSTLEVISVSEPIPGPIPPKAIYKDGTPVGAEFSTTSGDGTVTVCSAILAGANATSCSSGGSPIEVNNGWSTYYVAAKGKHTSLMKKFKTEIREFLNAENP